MANPARSASRAIGVSVGAASLLAWLGSTDGATVVGLPLFAACALLAFAINWLAFVPAYRLRTERFYDLTGALTHLAVITLALGLAPSPDARAWLLAALVSIWAVRLGSFLFRRIRREGSDRRFDRIKQSAPRFLMAWTLQGLWVFLTLACALAAITTTVRRPLGWAAGLGLLVWIAGFTIEVTADRQKQRLREDTERRDEFITTGLWAWSRHPNYLGEILLWIGVALIAWPVLAGGQLATLISPVFVYVLLTRVSGIPLLEARADERWGGLEAYEAYKARTPVLFPRPPGR